MLTAADTRERLVQRDLAWAGLALVVAVGAGLATGYAIRSEAIPDPNLQLLLAYLSTWVPLGVAMWAVFARDGWTESVARLGLRFGVLDLFWGVAGGCIGRLMDALCRLQFTGTTGLAPQPVLGTPMIDGWVVALGIIAPVIIAPVVEELFFRGLVQRSLASALRGRRIATVLAILITSVLFSLAHVAVGGVLGVQVIALGLSTFAFSVIAGAIVAATGRLGGAIVAHVVFNGAAVLLLWPY
jgi:membrane protease YdiL (CAAX protease family)